MESAGLIAWLFIGGIAGWLAGKIYKGFGFGLIGNIIIGIIGSVFGGFVLSLVGFQSTGMIGSIITAVIGAILLLYIVGLFTRNK
ncbi:GlsB/YeaQ/YmgE family stress response membrane protein [Otariodibacter oris]|uniref:Putative membrane protein YeaQ/YmgE (Transglycosylase-associated protein family) n=1 Tax=Otariodibacter oris TaxID=1032623 RepID=A0A420XGS4_9PAST|nr:GlsB/YeaQ/YmgE family stress response membrane protein [Otariodibacter oris]QGM81186.1 transglycosylase [Otariodibacter oris]RKR72743.1 putative membrane protein YeaQ/YmgE (transglycosylase-associated protein family) [Otariodibacter oris]